ncbi:uncharacterized protein LOC131670394 isoform X2 [Phymastichus coffea]|nr:uncharacterized protein LOC131670394 isoform X2 [Phymastichus coffea]
MNFYNSRYFVINQNLLKFLGLWPYQTKMTKILIRMVITASLIISIVPQIIAAVQMRKNTDRLIIAVGTLVYIFGIGMKFFGVIFSESKLKFLYANMVKNWNMLKNETEKKILEESSELGRLLTICYIGYMVPAGLLFLVLPFAYHIFDKSQPLMFVLEGEYFVDREEYYYPIYLFETFTILASIPLIFTIDSTYAVCIQQCIGLFDVVKQRLACATEWNNKLKLISYRTNDAAYEAIIKSAELHEKVLNFSHILELSYSSSLLAVMIANVLVLAAAVVTILLSFQKPVLLFRALLLSIGFTIHMFYLSWPGQKMIDSSNDV